MASEDQDAQSSLSTERDATKKHSFLISTEDGTDIQITLDIQPSSIQMQGLNTQISLYDEQGRPLGFISGELKNIEGRKTLTIQGSQNNTSPDSQFAKGKNQPMKPRVKNLIGQTVRHLLNTRVIDVWLSDTFENDRVSDGAKKMYEKLRDNQELVVEVDEKLGRFRVKRKE